MSRAVRYAFFRFATLFPESTVEFILFITYMNMNIILFGIYYDSLNTTC